MTFDLGMEPDAFNDRKELDDLVSQINSAFHVVMITERFNESLVLLAEKLCWPLESMVAFPKNALPVRTLLSDGVKSRIAELNEADWKLYTFFAGRIEEELRRLGPKYVEEQVSALSNLTNFWYQRCVESVGEGYVRTHNLRADMKNDKMCQMLAITELDFTREVRATQTRRARRLTGYFYS